MSKILNGKVVADAIAQQLKNDIKQSGRKLTLGIIQVGSEPSSTIYIQYKMKMAAKLGVEVRYEKLSQEISQAELLDVLQQWNHDARITGYIVQLPLSPHLNPEEIINAIAPNKDVDGLTALNKGLLSTNQPTILPATTRGIISLIDYYQIELAGRHVVVLGRSNLVGLPTAIALLHRHATVSILHSKSTNVKNTLALADIVVAAIGKPGYLDSELLSSKTIVIDVGITSVDGKLYGDTNFEQVKDDVKAITPVPGGIGPLTVISLFQNLFDISNT